MFSARAIAVVDAVVRASATWLTPDCPDLNYWRIEFICDLHIKYNYPVWEISRLVDMALFHN